MLLDPSRFMPIVGTLERKGLIKQKQDSRDWRLTLLTLTRARTDLLAQGSLLESESVLVKSLSQMDAQQRQQLLDLLSQFVILPSDEEGLVAFCHSLRREMSTKSLTLLE